VSAYEQCQFVGRERPLLGEFVLVPLPLHRLVDELLGLLPGDAPGATWTLDCTVSPAANGVDVKGPYVQGPPGGRFIYLSWGTVDDARVFKLLRRAKLWLDAIPSDVLRDAVDRGVLVACVGLTDQKGNPLCAAVRPPTIDWSAAAS